MSSDAGGGRSSEEAAEPDVIIGRVCSVNVPKKQLRIAPETSYPERFKGLDELRLRPRRGSGADFAKFAGVGSPKSNLPGVVMAVESLRITEKTIIVNLGGNPEGDLIASLRGAEVIVRHSERYPLPEDEYYIDDLVGLTVKDKDGRVIGRLCEVWETPANHIYQVLDDEGGEILLPAVENVILNVDVNGGEMIADISNLI